MLPDCSLEVIQEVHHALLALHCSDALLQLLYPPCIILNVKRVRDVFMFCKTPRGDLALYC